MKKLTFTSLILIIFLFTAKYVFSEIITATGIGTNRILALEDAKRNAVEQACGYYLSSTTKVCNGILLMDRIKSASSGFIKNYDILNEDINSNNNIYQITIRADVDIDSLRDFAQRFSKDPIAQKSFQKQYFHNRRIFVFYNTSSSNINNKETIQYLKDQIRDKLVEKGFRVFLEKEIQRIVNRLSSTLDLTSALNIAKLEKCDAIIEISFDIIKKEKRSIRPNQLICIISMKAYDVTTGELFAAKTIPMNTYYQNSQEAILKIVLNRGSETVEQLINSIVTRFTKNRQNFIYLVFKNVPISLVDKIEDIFELNNIEYRVNLQTKSYIEYEVITNLPATKLRRVLRKNFKRINLKLQTIELKGDRVVFSVE